MTPLTAAQVAQSEIHNRIVGPIVASIVKPPLDAGGGPTDVMVITESVLVGVVLMLVNLGGDEMVLDTMVEGVKARLAKIRLSNIEVEGRG